MQELAKQARALADQITDATTRLQLQDDRRRLEQLQDRQQDPDFWQDPADASQISQEAAGLSRHVEGWEQLSAEVAELIDLLDLGDSSLQADIETRLKRLTAQFKARQFELKLSGPYDKSAAILSIYAGTGGTDAQDWAQMLLRMYLRYCERAGYLAAILDQSAGEEAGIKSVTVEIHGQFAYGRLKSEQGVHRLVRLSPFNADHLRQTSFALVEVVPQLQQAKEVELDPAELRIDVYRAGGHGGQSVNTTDSAVRITHLPTGITVAIQNERSQLQNKDKAMAVLKSRLALLMHQQHKAKVSEIRGETQSAAWGNQIRSYVLHPYTKVKDHRTGEETSASAAVLDGEIEPFIEAYLTHQIGNN